MDEKAFLEMASKHLKKGAFAKKAEAPKAEYPQPLAAPKKTVTVKHVQPIHHDEEEIHVAPAKKTKRAPTAWNALVTKHYAMVKGETDAFKKAIKMAQDERAGIHHAAPKPKKEAVSKKKLQVHLSELEDS